MDDNKRKKQEWARLARLSSIGIFLVIATFIGFGIGWYIDKWLHLSGVFTIIFLLLGIVAGFINVFRTIARDTREPGDGDDDRGS